MLRDERDYLLRMIAAAAAAVARLRSRILEGDTAGVVSEARLAQRELLGRDAGVLLMLDPRSAAQMLRGDPRMAAWLDLLRVEADALRAAGQDQEADAVDSRLAAMKTIQSATN